MLRREITNQSLNQLLQKLGFQCGKPVKPNSVVWRHPTSGCALVLPANKLLDRARPADVVGIEAQLESYGHLDGTDFESQLAGSAST